MNTQDNTQDAPKLDIPLAADAAPKIRPKIFHVTPFQEMDGSKVRLINAYTPILKEGETMSEEDQRIGFAGSMQLRGPKGEMGPTIEFPIEAASIHEAFEKFDETRKACLEHLKADARRKVLASGAGLGIEALKKLRSDQGRR